MGLSAEVSEPLLGWTEIMEFKFVGKTPKESTEKLEDKSKESIKSLSRDPMKPERTDGSVEALPVSRPL